MTPRPGVLGPYAPERSRSFEAAFLRWFIPERGGCLAVLFVACGLILAAELAAAGEPEITNLVLPENLRLTVTPRPWGDTFVPKSKPPASQLLAVDIGPLKTEERIAVTCLQGLTSRDQPRIWILREPLDQTWLDWHKDKGHISSYQVVTNWTQLFLQFSNVCRGAIVADTNLYRGELLALDVAECEDLIVASPELADRLHLPVKVDLRGRFKTYADGMRWVWATYKDRLNHHLCKYMHPSLLSGCNFGYEYEWRSVVFWIAGPVDQRLAGADPRAEVQVMAQIFAEIEPNIAVMGFPYGGEGIGLGEVAGVALAGRYGKGLVCSDFLDNTCVMSGVRIEKLTQPQQAAPPPLDQKSTYIALVMSDGDNENTWLAFFKNYFNHPSFGKFPLAFGMGPPLRDLMPAVAQWYYEHASPQTEFIADVSGVAYIQPENYGFAYKERDQVFAGFLDWTARTMGPLGMRTVRTVGGEDDLVRRYAKALPFCHSIFADMGRYSGREGIENLTYSLPGGTPVFRAVTSWRYGKDGFLKEIREQVGSHRPAFVNGFVHCWTFAPDDLERIYHQRDTDMVFVTPTQLAQLYRQARERGWAK